MSISIAQNAQLAYSTVLKGDPKVEWAIFSLASAGNELKLQGTGSGLDDLEEEFMDGRIQYAFARIEDPGSNLEKFVQINWCGDGVAERQKGLFNTYSPQIASFLKGAHVVLQARNEGDVTPEQIRKRMHESSGSKYGAGNAPSATFDAPSKAPVTSAPKPNLPSASSFSRPTPAPAFNKPIPAPAPAAAPPPREPSPPPPAPAPAASQAPEPSKPAQEDRIGPVGTNYEPVKLPAPKKLANRWGAGGFNNNNDDDEDKSKDDKPKVGAFAAARSAFSGGGGGASTGGAASSPGPTPGKKLTWSERQAQAKKQREEEEKASAQAIGSVSSSNKPVTSSKPLTWSERQAQAKQQQADEEPSPPAQEHKSEVEEATEAIHHVSLADRKKQMGIGAGGAAIGAAGGAAVAGKASQQDEPEEEEVAPPPPPPPAPLPPRVPDPVEDKADDEDDWDDAPPPPPPPPPAAAATPSAPAAQEEDDDDAPPPPPPPPPMPMPDSAAEEAAPPPPPMPSRPDAAPPAEDPAPPAAPPMPSRETAKKGGLQAKALYDYEAAEENEIGFAEDDVITGIEQTDPDWWTGVDPKTGKQGLFPANYVELIEEEAPAPAAAAPAAKRNMPPPPDAAPAAPPPPPAASQGKTAVAQYDYEAAEGNELSFSENDLIIQIEETDPDWWTGTNSKTGQTGLFPANYVE